MKEINLRELYPDIYKTDALVEVKDEVLAVIRASEQAEAAYQRRKYRYNAHFSLDRGDGIEHDIMHRPLSPDAILEEKLLREQLYAAVMALPEKQAKRIYARYYLGMSVTEIARAEGVSKSRISESIRHGLKKLSKILFER